MTVCGHYFHSGCIYSWLENHKTCPNCNKETDVRMIRRWCSQCRAVLMPVVRGVNLNSSMKRSGKSKK